VLNDFVVLALQVARAAAAVLDAAALLAEDDHILLGAVVDVVLVEEVALVVVQAMLGVAAWDLAEVVVVAVPHLSFSNRLSY